jgi:hypothetical protein
LLARTKTVPTADKEAMWNLVLTQRRQILQALEDAKRAPLLRVEISQPAPVATSSPIPAGLLRTLEHYALQAA